jgi:AcrR family transcriptional regulator
LSSKSNSESGGAGRGERPGSPGQWDETAGGPRRRLSAQQRRELIEAAASELFAKRGYLATSIDEIARRSGITAPVVYDHFASKLELHRRLLERHFAELRALWREQLAGEEPPEQRIPRAIDAWFAYVESHPYAWRMLFGDTSGEADVKAEHEQVIASSAAAITPLFLAQPGVKELVGADRDALEMAWVTMRGVLQGLALWWYEHQHVPRERVVESAMNALWIGFERLSCGERWEPRARARPAGGVDRSDQTSS